MTKLNELKNNMKKALNATSVAASDVRDDISFEDITREMKKTDTLERLTSLMAQQIADCRAEAESAERDLLSVLMFQYGKSLMLDNYAAEIILEEGKLLEDDIRIRDGYFKDIITDLEDGAELYDEVESRCNNMEQTIKFARDLRYALLDDFERASRSVEFNNGSQMEVGAVGLGDYCDNSTYAVLYKNGQKVAECDYINHHDEDDDNDDEEDDEVPFYGDWALEYDGTIYVVHVVKGEPDGSATDHLYFSRFCGSTRSWTVH